MTPVMMARAKIVSPMARCASQGGWVRQEREADLSVADGGQHQLVDREGRDHRREDHLHLGDVAVGQV